MFFPRLILGFGAIFFLGKILRIAVEVRRRGSWNDREAEECLSYLLYAVVLIAVTWLMN